MDLGASGGSWARRPRPELPHDGDRGRSFLPATGPGTVDPAGPAMDLGASGHRLPRRLAPALSGSGAHPPVRLSVVGAAAAGLRAAADLPTGCRLLSTTRRFPPPPSSLLPRGAPLPALVPARGSAAVRAQPDEHLHDGIGQRPCLPFALTCSGDGEAAMGFFRWAKVIGQSGVQLA